jgi:hypothetical protein
LVVVRILAVLMVRDLPLPIAAESDLLARRQENTR